VYACLSTVEGAGDKTSVSRRSQDSTEAVQSVPQSSAGKDVEGRAQGTGEEDEGRAAAEDGHVVATV